jgi:hypothetical protein
MEIFPQSLVFENYTKTTSKNQGTALDLNELKFYHPIIKQKEVEN